MRSLRFALRRLLRQPGFAAAAIATLGLGIAAPTALFTVVNALLIQPLPYERAADIYTVRTAMTDGRFTIGLLASEEIGALRRSTDAIDAAAMVVRLDDIVVTDATSRQVTTFGVSEGFFDLFGVPMARGRSFAPDDHTDARPGTVRNVVLAHHAWVGLFGADPSVLGRTIRLASGPALVVGVAPATFDLPRDADLWIAVHFPESIGHAYDAYVRFRPGLTPATLQTSLGPMWQGLAVKYPDMERNRTFVMRPLLQSIVGDLGPIAVIALAATGVLLLLAIVNVANLLVARGAARSREIAVRTTLGATTGDLVRQLLGESLVIAAAATVAGLSLAYAAVGAIIAVGGNALPRSADVHFSPTVWAFAALVMAASAVAIALLPAARMASPNLAAAMNEGGRSALHGRGTRRTLGLMVVIELALAIALVSGAGRLLLSMSHLVAIDPGFDARNRLVVDVLLPNRVPERIDAWEHDAEERLRALGATSVATASTLPLRHEWDSTSFVDIVDHPVPPDHRPNGRIRTVSPDFFESLRIPILAGRTFAASDRRGSAPVVIVNRAWVRKFIPDEDPLATRVELGFFGKRVDNKFVVDPAAIIGVAGDVQYSSLTQDPEPVVYICDAQVPTWRRSLVVQTSDKAPERLVPQIRTALNALDPTVPLEFDTMAHGVAAALTWPKLGLMLMSTFGVAGLVLTASGVFGVIAFVVAQRLSEMAVRLAVGATRGQVFRLVLVDTLRLAATGLAIGLLLAWWAGQLMGRYVYQVAPANLTVLGGSAVAVLAVALVATLPLAGRAATIEPARALRP